MKLKVLIHASKEGGFWAEVPGLPGCVSEGEDLPETLSNIRDAAEGWIEVARGNRGQTTLLLERQKSVRGVM
jgi:predicted RNase H-like HicB family nuclease